MQVASGQNSGSLGYQSVLGRPEWFYSILFSLKDPGHDPEVWWLCFSLGRWFLLNLYIFSLLNLCFCTNY